MKKHTLKTVMGKAQPFYAILKHVAEKHPNAWENKKREMENKHWVPLLEIEKLKENLQGTPKVSKKIKQWLANNESLPLMTKIQMVLSLYNKEMLGEI